MAEAEDFEEGGSDCADGEGEDPAEVFEAGFEAEAEDEGCEEEDEEGFAEDSEEGAGGVHTEILNPKSQTPNLKQKEKRRKRKTAKGGLVWIYVFLAVCLGFGGWDLGFRAERA